MNRRQNLSLALALAAGAMICSPDASAFSYVMPSDASLYQQSEGALLVRVIEELSGDTRGQLPNRRWRVEVDQVLSGAPRLGEAVLRLPGASPEDKRGMFLPGVPALMPGERVLVFYGSGPDAELRPIQLSLGLFFESSFADGKRAYVRALDDSEAVPGKSANSMYHLPRDADRFDAWIAGGGRGHALSYLGIGLEKAQARGAKFSLIRHSDGTPLRWFTFDTGGSVIWQAQENSPLGSDFDPDASLQAAMNAWNNDPKSRIDYRYVLTRVVSDPGNDGTNGINAVVWDDPGNDIGGSFNCGQQDGVLGIGGMFFGGPARAFDGSDYYFGGEGFLITQDAAGCFFNSDVKAAEVFTHEFGHTLGFGHTCSEPGLPACATNPVLDDATMRGQIHNDGRGAAIRSDDQAAALRVYPSPSYIHPQETVVDSLSAGLTGCVSSGSRDASSSADGSVIVFQTTCTGGVAKADGRPVVMVLDRKQCAKQLGAKSDDSRCSEKNWLRYTKAEPISTGLEPSISANGKFAVFVSDQPQPNAKHLIPADLAKAARAKGNSWTVWMRNLISGSNFSMTPGASTGAGTQPQISPDGTTIAFVSDSLPENGAGDFSDATPDVFQIKPVFGGGGDPIGPGTTVCASCKDAQTVNLPAANPAISANGGQVAFAAGTSSWLRNMISGTSNQMTPPVAGGVVPAPSMDYSGGTIVINTSAPLDDDGSDGNGKEDVYTFESCCNKFTRVSKPDAELPNPGDQMPSGQPVISGDGRRIAFISRAQNLMGFTPESNGNENVFSYDVLERIKRRYSRNTAGAQSNGDSARPFLNYTGSVVLFDTAATNFDGADSNGVQDVIQRANPQSEFVVFYAGFD